MIKIQCKHPVKEVVCSLYGELESKGAEVEVVEGHLESRLGD